MNEQVMTFRCGGETLVGILHRGAGATCAVGIVIIVGGPQYRVGSHRQFVLMARAWAAQGYSVLRFDYRGMGDSTGESRSFDSVDDDVRAAVDVFQQHVPDVRKIVLFGLCDAASAALMSANSDPRLQGLILANPWVRTPEGEARSYIRHYYGARLLQRSFWSKALSGKLGIFASLREFVSSWFRSRRSAGGTGVHSGTFLERMQRAFASFPGRILVLISEQDLTAREFTDLCKDAEPWKRAVTRRGVAIHTLRGADHTFSSRRALDEAVAVSAAWLLESGKAA